MVIMVLQNVPPSLRGKLSQYLVETANGVFIGKLSARVREKLWDICVENKKEGVVFQAWSYNNEQGFDMRMVGGNRVVTNWEGLQFVVEPGKPLTKIERKRLNGEV